MFVLCFFQKVKIFLELRLVHKMSMSAGYHSAGPKIRDKDLIPPSLG